MSGPSQPADRPGWRQLLDLGEQLIAQPTVAAQRELIVETAVRLVGGQAELWLAEPLHRLPGAEEALSFPAEPPSDSMRRTLDTTERVSALLPPRGEPEGGIPAVAVPLLAHDAILGVLEVKRPDGPPFSDAESELLEGLATQSAIALQATRRVAIERWRVEQLSLVRQVSAQVANVLDLDELARRVTSLILETFKYYYVALFTLDPGQELLRCRASAGPTCPRPDQGALSPTLQVRLGQGIIGNVAQTGVEILANDVSREPRYRHVDALPETRSEVALPLKIGARVLGVLDVQSDQADDFDGTDMLVLRALADNIAIAVEDARLYTDLRHRADQLSAAAGISRAIASILDLDTLLNKVVTLIHEQLGYPFVHLFTVNPARRQIVYRAGLPHPPPRGEEERLIRSLDDLEGIVPWVACHGETVLVNDVSRDPRYRPAGFSEDDARSELAVPLIFGDQVLGVLDVQSDRRDAFGDDDRLLFEALADSVAIAIRNANLYRSEQWRRQVADSMREVASLLSAGVALDQVLDAILTALERTLPCDVAAIWLLRDDDLCLSAVHGHAAEMCVSDFLSEVGTWLSQALSADQPTIRTPQSPPEPLGSALGFPPDYSAIAAPLRIGARQLGVLTLAHRTPGRYGAESRAMTAAFASYAAVAIENTRLYQAAEEQAYVSTVLLQVAEATQSLTTLDQVLETVVRLVPMLVGVERCAVFLWDDEEAVFCPAQTHGVPRDQEPVLRARRYARGDFPLLDAVRERESLVVPSEGDGLIPPDFSADFTGDTLGEPGALLAVPLSVKGDVLGVMLVEEGDTSRGFSERRREIITGIAHQAAVAVQNDRLQQELAERERLGRELQLAREIQQTFMPSQLPHLPGWELAAAWRAARQVGGDFYDFFELPGGRLGLVIADVADKGMPAALFMALTRALVRAAVLEETSPAAALDRVNDLLVPDAQHGMFVTAVYAVLSLETGELAYANAGHNPPLLLRSRTRGLERLGKGGMALGVLEGVQLEEHIVSLESGDYLIFYTDGVTEAFSPQGDIYGEKGLRAAIQAAADGSAQALLDAINASIIAFVGATPPSDDQTLMVLRRR